MYNASSCRNGWPLQRARAHGDTISGPFPIQVRDVSLVPYLMLDAIVFDGLQRICVHTHTPFIV